MLAWEGCVPAIVLDPLFTGGLEQPQGASATRFRRTS
jgi:hypothetical protein